MPGTLRDDHHTWIPVPSSLCLLPKLPNSLLGRFLNTPTSKVCSTDSSITPTCEPFPYHPTALHGNLCMLFFFSLLMEDCKLPPPPFLKCCPLQVDSVNLKVRSRTPKKMLANTIHMFSQRPDSSLFIPSQGRNAI